MTIFKRAPSGPSSQPGLQPSSKHFGTLDPNRLQGFAQYLASIGFTPGIAGDIDAAEFCQRRDEAWEEVIRQIRGHAPDPEPNPHVPGIIARLGRLARNQPARGHEL